MSIEYEQVFNSKFKTYERVFDTETKKSTINQIDVKQTVFTKSKGNKPTDFKLLLNQEQYVEKHTFNNNKQFKEFNEFQKQIGATTYGKIKDIYSHIRDNYYFDKKDFKSRIWYFDIEVRVLPDMGFPHANETPAALCMVQLYDTFLDKVIVLADQDMSPEFRIKMEKKFPNLIYKAYESEKKLYKAFYGLIEKLNPAIITAWNGHGFDFPYLVNRANKIGIGSAGLSPVGNAEVREMTNSKTNKVSYSTKWDGIVLLDMMELYQKFTFITQVSYSLENILMVELGAGNGKVDYGEFKNFSDFLHGNWDKFSEYGIYDAVRLHQLDQKMNLVELTRMISYMTGINPDDALGTVKPWGIYINNIAYERGLILPNDSGNPEYNGITGGWVAAPKKGKHEWIISFDFASLYPSIMRWNNISPETYIKPEELPEDLKIIKEKFLHLETPSESNVPVWDMLEKYFFDWRDRKEAITKVGKILKKHNVSCGVNGAFFKNDNLGIVPDIIKKIYTERKGAKKIMFEHEQNIEDIKKAISKLEGEQ